MIHFIGLCLCVRSKDAATGTAVIVLDAIGIIGLRLGCELCSFFGIRGSSMNVRNVIVTWMMRIIYTVKMRIGGGG